MTRCAGELTRTITDGWRLTRTLHETAPTKARGEECAVYARSKKEIFCWSHFLTRAGAPLRLKMLQASRMKIERAKMQELFSCSAKIDDAVEHHRGELASEAVRSLSPDPRAFAMVIREAEDEGIAYTVDVSPQGP